MSGGATKVHRFILVKLWCFTLDQFDPRLGICVASSLEVIAALGGEEAEKVLTAAFWVFKVADGIEVVEADLFEETLLSRRFVEREEVGAEDKVEGFPLFCLSGAFMHLSASEYTIKGETTILVDRRKGVEIEVPTSNT